MSKKRETFKPNSDPFCLLRDISCLHRALRPNMPLGLFLLLTVHPNFPIPNTGKLETLENIGKFQTLAPAANKAFKSL